jgi:hypothetical protein
MVGSQSRRNEPPHARHPSPYARLRISPTGSPPSGEIRACRGDYFRDANGSGWHDSLGDPAITPVPVQRAPRPGDQNRRHAFNRIREDLPAMIADSARPGDDT